MKIAFNGIGCGWGNNGGTQSVLRMCDALNEIDGVHAEVWAHVPSRFTWFKPKTKVRVCRLKSAPDVDVLINSGCSTTIDTYRFARKKVGVQWLRGHETWRLSKNKLFNLYGLSMPLWANSEWMADLVRSAGIRDDTEVQYCGVPHQEFYPVDVEKDTTKLHIGALWSEKPRKRGVDILEVAAQCKGEVQWHLFGNTAGPRLPENASYVRRPSMERKRALYSKCDVWFAPTISEGLHIPPMEAALCGAAVLTRDKLSAGSIDYCIPEQSGLHFSTPDEAVQQLGRLRDTAYRKELNEKMKALVRGKIGDVPTNAKRMVERLEKLL
jgi:glycosyltransferase involved in cell wall biosynthesis